MKHSLRFNKQFQNTIIGTRDCAMQPQRGVTILATRIHICQAPTPTFLVCFSKPKMWALGRFYLAAQAKIVTPLSGLYGVTNCDSFGALIKRVKVLRHKRSTAQAYRTILAPAWWPSRWRTCAKNMPKAHKISTTLPRNQQ